LLAWQAFALLEADQPGRVGSGGPEGPTTAAERQAFSDAGSILKPGPMVEDRVMRLT
jgi:hypothetical protein